MGLTTADLATAGRNSRGKSGGTGPSVWIVEDSPLEAEMTRRALASRYAVEIFLDGSNMLERLSEGRGPDVLVLDWQLPGLSGIEICHFVRSTRDEVRLPILILTAYGHKADIVEGLSAGANDYVTKPFDPTELLARVTTLARSHQLHAQLGVERGRLEHLFTALPAFFATFTGPDHRVAFINPNLRALWGGQDPLGRPVREAYAALASSGLFDGWDRVYASGEAFNAREVRIRPTGDSGPGEQFISLSLLPQREPDGEVSGVLAFAIEVTDEVQARNAEAEAKREHERLLSEARREHERAEKANLAKDEFLAMVSHELRTPLNSINGWVKLLRGGLLPPEKVAPALATIERNAAAQTQLIDDLLDVSRIISGKMRIEALHVDPSTVVQNAVEAVQPSAQAKGIALEAAIEVPVGDVIGDSARLQQIVWNLLTNAVKFTPKGGRVLIRLARRGAVVEIAVEDTGRGLSAEFLPRVFERFVQADASVTRSIGGLGLGLAIVRHLVELHGGSIEAASEGEGKGSTFVVRLPSAGAGAEVLTPASRSALPPPDLSGCVVLIVDDDPDSQDVLRAVLEGCRAEVHAASSAAEGMALLQSVRPMIMISDVGMPGEDGHALIARVRALPAASGGTTPAIALTAYARAEDREKALTAGFDVHVSKPVDPSELLGVLGDLLRNKRSAVS